MKHEIQLLTNGNYPIPSEPFLTRFAIALETDVKTLRSNMDKFYAQKGILGLVWSKSDDEPKTLVSVAWVSFTFRPTGCSAEVVGGYIFSPCVGSHEWTIELIERLCDEARKCGAKHISKGDKKI